MSGGRPWTTGEVRNLNAMRAKRMTAIEIGAALGRTQDAIYNFLRYVPATPGHGASLKPTNRKPLKPVKERRDNDWTPEEVSRLRELASDGNSARDISGALGRSQSAVFCKASNLGVSLTTNRSICQMDREMSHYNRNAIEGSAMLLDAMLALAA